MRRFHRLRGRHVLHGEVTTVAPASALARLLARALGSPRAAASGPIRFELDGDADGETWTRHFPGRTMSSRPRIVAEETGAQGADGRVALHFRVEVHMPGIGQAVGYRGHLWLPDEAASPRG